ncbi:extracellular solute-binding protein [Aureimonas fodinaquatilis]|uniref:extracellular solute-binding protein n=1 Tax=Aureimonas fodinaquatilis TaxID=2565783 RepID=UPI00165E1B1F|nr:extracellular solute-binding protein [Aureimonas fodinaquatilis]
MSKIEITRRRILMAGGAGAALGLFGGAFAAFAQTSGPTNLNSWYFAQEPNNTVLQAILSAYATQGGGQVSTSGVAFNSYLDQAILAARSRRLSGVLHLDFNWLPAMSQLGILRPMDDLMETLGYTQAGKQLGTLDGKSLGLPVTAATINMVTNSDLLEAAGIAAVPSTTAEFEVALDKLKVLKADMIPYALSTVPSESIDYLVWMWQFGSEVMRGRECLIGDEPSVNAMEWIKGLYDAGYMAPSVTRADARAMFAQERTGFYEDAIVARSNAIAVSGNPDFGRKVVPVPRPGLKAGDRPRSSLWGNVMTVIDDDGAANGVELATYLTANTDTSVALYNGIGLPPATEAGLKLPEIAEDEYTSIWSNQITAYADIKPFGRFPQVLRLEGLVGEAVQRILLGGIPAKEALEQCASEVRNILA